MQEEHDPRTIEPTHGAPMRGVDWDALERAGWTGERSVLCCDMHDPMRRCALAFVIERGLGYGQAQALLGEGADANTTDEDGCTVLMSACRLMPGLVMDLLAAGGEPHAVDNYGRTALFHLCLPWIFHPSQDPCASAMRRDDEMAALAGLIDRGADIQAQDHSVPGIFLPTSPRAVGAPRPGMPPTAGSSALHGAACGHPWLIEMLLEAGADRHARDGHGYTPLMAALAAGRRAVDLQHTLVLLTDGWQAAGGRRGMDIDGAHVDWSAVGNDGATALVLAAVMAPDTVEALIAAGAPIDTYAEQVAATAYTPTDQADSLIRALLTERRLRGFGGSGGQARSRRGGL